MWTTVVLLAVALNFEPTRLTIVALLLIRPHPIRQLVAFLGANVITSATAGLTVLLILHYGIRPDFGNGAKLQIGIGVFAVVLGAVLASGFTPAALRGGAGAGAAEPPDHAQEQLQLAQRITARAEKLVRGDSPWFAPAVGMIIALPSVDYVALLVLIATSGAEPAEQVAALLTFLAIANTVLLIPVLSYLLAPERTRRALARLREWVLARRRRDYAALLMLAGVLMIGVGISGL